MRRKNFGARVNDRAQERVGTQRLGIDHEPERFATPLADAAFEIRIDHLRPCADQPRKHFAKDELQELADSIRRDGVLQAIPVNRTDDPSIFEIESGERRWRASKIAGLKAIPCVVRERIPDRGTIRRRQLAENIHRSDLKPIEAARSLAAYLREAGLSHRKAADDLSKPKTWVAELLTILTISASVLEKLEDRERNGKALPKRALVELSAVKDPAEQDQLYEHMIASRSPWAVAREARRRRNDAERPTKFQRVLTHRDFPSYRLSVSSSARPENVDPSEVASFIESALAEYMNEQAQRVSRP